MADLRNLHVSHDLYRYVSCIFDDFCLQTGSKTSTGTRESIFLNIKEVFGVRFLSISIYFTCKIFESLAWTYILQIKQNGPVLVTLFGAFLLTEKLDL